MQKKNGQLSVESENIFPIIKQWLYSEEEIFLREIVSNAVDAHSKRRHLMLLGEAAAQDDLKIKVHYASATRTLTISDQGVGMTAEELDRYINQIAYSGLLDFVEKYKGSAQGGQAVIGHFGLGFYSSFMVAEQVEIDSLSYQEGAEAVRWSSNDGLSYSMESGQRSEVGSDIIIHLTEESAKTYDAGTLRRLLKKYCAFMTEPIFFQEDETDPVLINDTDPLWLKSPKAVSEQEYLDFYHRNFDSPHDPLFWIHLNLDYPFRLKGILYFPAETSPYVDLNDRIRVYSKQVFVSDNLREMIPDFLFLLQGCLDCPDLPLNVSRSYLQNDRTVRALSKHIVSKVADRLKTLYTDDLPTFKKIWPKMENFVKVGSLQNANFAEKALGISLVKELSGELFAVEDLPEGKLYYIYDDLALSSYAQQLQAQGEKVYIFNQSLDLQWMSLVEQQYHGNLHFLRADAEAKGEVSESTVEESWSDYIKEALQEDKLKIELRKLNPEDSFITLVEDESSRRFLDLQKAYAPVADEKTLADMAEIAKDLVQAKTVVINENNPLYAEIRSADSERVRHILHYASQLALLSRGELKGEEFSKFLRISEELLAN